MKTQIEGMKIRKWCEYFEEVSCNEISQKVDPKPLHKFAVGAVILNPYAGTFSENLQLLTDPSKEFSIGTIPYLASFFSTLSNFGRAWSRRWN